MKNSGKWHLIAGQLQPIATYFVEVQGILSHTAALFKIAKIWKQAKCPSTAEWIKICFIYTLNGILVLKKSETMPSAATWMDLEMIILSQVSQTEKDKCHVILLICRM